MVPKSNKSKSNQIRIIAGKWGGRKIQFVDSIQLRPTPDRVRETLFNWLQQHISGTRVLDLFAGSGALGLEALSRGAQSVVAVERDRTTINQLKKTASILQAENYAVVHHDAKRFMQSYTGLPFNLVFLDPPHHITGYQDICDDLTKVCLANQALIYIEFSKSSVPEFRAPVTWSKIKSSMAGEVVYQLWCHRLLND